MNFFRKTLWGIAALSVLTACGSFVSQYVLGMNPCVLCILQRLSVLAVGLAALSAAFSGSLRIRADGLRVDSQYSGSIRGGGGGLSALYPEPAARYGARMRRAVDVSFKGLAAV